MMSRSHMVFSFDFGFEKYCERLFAFLEPSLKSQISKSFWLLIWFLISGLVLELRANRHMGFSYICDMVSHNHATE